MKKLWIGLVAAGLVFSVACDNTTTDGIGGIPGTPQNLTAVSTNGTDLVLSWDASYGPTGDTLKYYIYFNGNIIDSTFQTTYSIAQGQIGTYEVSAINEAGESDRASISTVPISISGPFSLVELDTVGNSGLGIDLTNGTASTYPMANASAPANVDLYFTDGEAGSGGLFVYLASPSEVVNAGFENGCANCGIPTSGWRTTYIKENAVTNGIADPGTTLHDFANAGSVYAFALQRGNDRYYGSLTISSINGNTVLISQIKVQRVPGFKKLQ